MNTKRGVEFDQVRKKKQYFTNGFSAKKPTGWFQTPFQIVALRFKLPFCPLRQNAFHIQNTRESPTWKRIWRFERTPFTVRYCSTTHGRRRTVFIVIFLITRVSAPQSVRVVFFALTLGFFFRFSNGIQGGREPKRWHRRRGVGRGDRDDPRVRHNRRCAHRRSCTTTAAVWRTSANLRRDPGKPRRNGHVWRRRVTSSGRARTTTCCSQRPAAPRNGRKE